MSTDHRPMNTDTARTTRTTGVPSAFDVIVIGAGVNSLVAAAYLAKAGRKVLVLERRATVGGSASTHEMEPGFRVDSCRDDLGWLSTSVMRDLGLDARIKIISTSNPIVASDGNGAVLTFTGDGVNLDELRKLSPKDAQRWPEFAARVEALTGFLREMYAAPVPDTALGETGDLKTGIKLALKYRGLGKAAMVDVLRVLPMSIAEWLDDWFEHPLLKGALASRGVTHSVFGPRAAGTAYVFLHHQVAARAGALRSRFVVEGGLGAYAQALAAIIAERGGAVRCDSPVQRIVVERGAVSGVQLASGERIAAARVMSGASPRHTFLELCDPARLAPEFVHAVSRIRYRGAWAKVNLTLDALPELPGSGARGFVVAPNMDYIERAADSVKYGRTSERPWLAATIPALTDATLAPAGKHVMSIRAQYAPYRLRDGSWDDAARAALGDRIMDTLHEHLPGVRALVRKREVFTPLDLEREFGLPEGDACHGEMALDQVMFMRPVPACSHYASPVKGLFVCGPGTHPGGNTAGQAGANAARAALAG